MNKLITILILLALTLPVCAFAQPEDGPRERPERDREYQRDRGERGERPDRPGDRVRPGDREGDRRGKREPLSIDQVEDALDTLRVMHGDAKPSWMQRIEKLAQEDPEKAAKALSRFPRIREMMEARKNKPEAFEVHARQSRLMREVFPLVRALNQAQNNEDQAKVDELTPKIRERIEKLFQIRLKLKEQEIKRIREKLARAEKELGEIKADSESLIDEKMNEILNNKGPRGPREAGDRPKRDDRRPKPERPKRDE